MLKTSSDKLIAGFALTVAVALLLLWSAATRPAPAVYAPVAATPWVVPVTSMPGAESQIATNPAVLRCWLKAGDRYIVRKSERFPIGLYIQVSATVDGKECYGWVKDWK